MIFLIFGYDWFMTMVGINHMVEILQSYVFFYFIFGSCFIFMLNWTSDLKRFFFFSELTWLTLFALLLSLSLITNSNALYANAFFILVFTACEAVTLACLLLLNFEARKKRSKL